MIKIGVKDLVEEAEANIETMTVDEVMNVKDDDNTILAVSYTHLTLPTSG